MQQKSWLCYRSMAQGKKQLQAVVLSATLRCTPAVRAEKLGTGSIDGPRKEKASR